MLSKDDITLPRGGYAPRPVKTLSYRFSLEHTLAPCSMVYIELLPAGVLQQAHSCFKLERLASGRGKEWELI